ncbi:MAG: hypothetical protein ACHQQQ_02145 [Bacteroidota bacterium]
MALEKELETYKRELPNLLVNEGKFVLIKGDKVIDTFATYEDAIKEGYKICGLEPFLVRKIQAVEQVHFFTRPISPSAPLSPER